jgi:hypothetical protein
MRLNKPNLNTGLWIALGICLWAQPGFAQNQAIFQDDRAIMQSDQQQIQQYQNAEQRLENQVEARDEKADSYRLYAEKRIQELSKIRNAGGSPTASLAKKSNGELYALQAWMKKDAQVRTEEQQHIKQLEIAIANLQQSESAASANLPNDVGAMRSVAQRQADDDKFNHMMQINYFNELQSEMGAASWGAPPRDGTYNSVGGYGFLGGYGYGMGGGRRFGAGY